MKSSIERHKNFHFSETEIDDKEKADLDLIDKMLADYNDDREDVDENHSITSNSYNISYSQASVEGQEELHIIHLQDILHQPIVCFTDEEQLRVDYMMQIDRESRINFFQALQEYNSTTLRRFVTSILSGNPLEFSVTCCGYICGLLKLIRWI